MTSAFGRCRATLEVGSGALSTVYKAVQEPLGRVVAIKALKPTISPSSPFAGVLEREARILGELHHPNVISLLDFVKTDKDLYLVLEYVDGKSLSELLARHKAMRPISAAALGAQIARGLSHVHSQGVVHRDVKPSNILLSKEGDVKIIDFGIAQSQRASGAEAEESEAMASAGSEDATAFGTPAYMSPEQILGEVVDARSDLFSLGVVLYQAIAGVRPFDADDERDDRTLAQRIRRDPAKPLSERVSHVPRPLERVVMRLLEKLPADRFSSSAIVADELAEIVGEDAKSPPALIVAALKEAGFAQTPPAFATFSEDPVTASTPSFAGAVLGFGGLFLLLLAGAITIRWGAHESETGDSIEAMLAASTSATGPGAKPPKRVSSLRFLVTPWAEVWIDGRYVDTTPFARAIPLSPGTHYVKLVHPDTEPENRTVRLAEGEARTLEVAMPVATKAVPAASAPSLGGIEAGQEPPRAPPEDP
jgi:eukaryotic-like serine/threonine-protein kinase